MFGVMAARGGGVDGAQFGRNKAQSFGLETADNFPDQAAFDGVGLADDEGAVHGAANLHESGASLAHHVQRPGDEHETFVAGHPASPLERASRRWHRLSL